VIPRLHLVTDDAILLRPKFLTQAKRVMDDPGSGQAALHLRGPRLTGRYLFGLAESLRKYARSSGTLLLLNDRVDIALALDLPGAHLGQRSLPASVARKLLGPDRVLGLSVHGIGEAEVGGAEDLDFLMVGTLFPTSSHEGEAPGGVGRLREVSGRASLPLIGIGGITPPRVGAVLGAGAHGIAVRSGVWEAQDPAGAVGVYLKELALRSGEAFHRSGRHGVE
jgi:thiamine-phosphate pyrophosphorylase